MLGLFRSMQLSAFSQLAIPVAISAQAMAGLKHGAKA